MNERLQAQSTCDFEKFTDLIKRLLSAAWGESWGTFCEAFPNGRDSTEIQLPVITYILTQMVPAVVGKSTREIRPRLRYTFRKEGPNGVEVVEVYGQLYECTVAFEVWEENNAKADKMAKKFRDLMLIYSDYLKNQGVANIVFVGMDNTTASVNWKDDAVCRKLVYNVRLEELTEIPVGLIEKVTGNVDVKNDLSANDITNQNIHFLNE